MAKRLDARQIAREKLLFRYSNALERGDFNTLSAILRQAESDPILERMILEVNEVYHLEMAQEARLNHRQAAPTIPVPLVRPPASTAGRRFYPTAALAAAVMMIVLVGSVLFVLKPGANPQPGGLVAPINSATPGQGSSVTPVNTLAFATSATPPPNIGVTVLCQVTTQTTGANLSALPDSTESITASLPAGIRADVILRQVDGDGKVWYFVQANVGGKIVQGWGLAERFTGECPRAAAAQIAAVPTIQPTTTQKFSGTVTPSGSAFSPAATPTSVFGNNWSNLVLLERVGNIPAGTRVNIASGYFNGQTWIFAVSTWDGSLYTDGVRESQLAYPPGVNPNVPTPTAVFSGTGGMGYILVLTQAIEEFPAGTRVNVSHYQFDGTEWVYFVLPEGAGARVLQARTAQLTYAPNITPGVTPTSAFDRNWQNLVTLEQVGNIPAGTRVNIGSGYFDGRVWRYTISTLDGSVFADNVRESQLAYAPGVNPNAPTATAYPATPTAYFDAALHSGGYDLITRVQVGNIPANTRVRLNGALFDGVKWLYEIVSQDGQTAQALETQLMFAANFVPGAPTPTAGFNAALTTNSWLITTQPVGVIAANTLVRMTAAWYDGSRWRYDIMTEDGRIAQAHESQLSSFAPQATPTPTPLTAPLSPTHATQAAYQQYQRGFMIWTVKSEGVSVFFNNGLYRFYSLARYQALPDNPISDQPPDGLLKPVNAFGRVWGNFPDVRDGLGWSLAGEQGYTATLTGDDGSASFTITTANGQTITVSGGTWRFGGE